MRARPRFFATARVLFVTAAAALLCPLAAQAIEVQEAWLKRNCMDKGNSDRPISQQEFTACVRKQAELLPPLDMNRRELFGEQYNPRKYVECRTRPGHRNNAACDIHILRRREWPEYWPEGAKRIKWPDAPKQSVYRKGMKPKEYWEALCKAEAGEFVFAEIGDIAAVYSVRPRRAVSDYELADRFVLEDPFTFTDVLATTEPQNFIVQPFLGAYRVLEIRHPDTQGFLQYFRNATLGGPAYQTSRHGRWVRVPYIVSSTPVKAVSAKFAYTWRGIVRPHDRANGIAGGELAIVNLETGELLGLRRGFAHSGRVPNSATGFWWLSAQRCPARNGLSSNMEFIQRILKPIVGINDGIKVIE